MPLVSIITPIYNSESFVADAVLSIMRQTFSDWELIAIDDCSTDGSAHVVNAFLANDARIRLVQLPRNSGVAIARNKAIELATGRYIAFLDSDDLWCAVKLQRQIEFMQSKDIAFSYSAYERLNESGNVLGIIGAPERLAYADLLKTCSIGCLTAMYDTHKLGKIYMPTNTKREDFATWLKMLKKVEYAYGVNEVLAQYRVYAAQSSAKKTEMAKETWRLYRDVERLGFIKSMYYFSHYAVRGVLRAKFPCLARRLGVLH